MEIVEPSVEVIFQYPDGFSKFEAFIEKCGRVCYKSEDKITNDSAEKFVGMICERGHHSVLEHCNATVHFVCDRGVTHELVRHRLASYSQESTRYCNYSKDKYGNKIGVIMPPFEGDEAETEACVAVWRDAMEHAERSYFTLLACGQPPQIARSVLPISLKTEIVMTANFREWMHVFRLRCAKPAHPQIRALMIRTLKKFVEKSPKVFGPLATELQIS